MISVIIWYSSFKLWRFIHSLRFYILQVLRLRHYLSWRFHSHKLMTNTNMYFKTRIFIFIINLNLATFIGVIIMIFCEIWPGLHHSGVSRLLSGEAPSGWPLPAVISLSVTTLQHRTTGNRNIRTKNKFKI